MKELHGYIGRKCLLEGSVLEVDYGS